MIAFLCVEEVLAERSRARRNQVTEPKCTFYIRNGSSICIGNDSIPMCWGSALREIARKAKRGNAAPNRDCQSMRLLLIECICLLKGMLLNVVIWMYLLIECMLMIECVLCVCCWWILLLIECICWLNIFVDWMFAWMYLLLEWICWLKEDGGRKEGRKEEEEEEEGRARHAWLKTRTQPVRGWENTIVNFLLIPSPPRRTEVS